MRWILTVPDAVAEKYQDHAATLGIPAEALCAQQLARFQDVKLLDRFVILWGPFLDRLAEILETPPIQHAEDLLTKVQRRAELKVDGVVAHLSVAQLEEITVRAEKNNRAFQEELATILQQAVDGLAHLV